MKSFKSWTYLTEAKSDATTFFHEVICGIACSDPIAAKQIEKGADIKQYFVNGTISAREGSGATTEATITNLPQYRFIDDSIDLYGDLTSEQATKEFFDAGNMSDRKNDAIKVAAAIVKRIGAPTGTVYWTGPTNDLSDYGAADIAYNEQGISLKYGKGQFKNLTVNQFARTALGSAEGNLLDELHDKVPEKWDNMTYDWLSLIGNALQDWKTGKDQESIQIKNKAIAEFIKIKGELGPDWVRYQRKKVDNKVVQLFHDLLYDPKMRSVYDKDDRNKARVKQFRYICRKIYDQGPASVRRDWKLKRNVLFTEIFGEYFEKQDETVKKNLKGVFERQISVGKKPIIYAAKGGTDIKRIPSKAEFDKNVDGITFSYEGKTTGAGYTFVLKAVTAKEAKKIMEISIFFRWKSAGQMMGNPDTSSDSKMFINDYAEIFLPEDN